MREIRIQQEREKSETHREGSKNETLESETSCLVRESEVKKVLLANKPLDLLYCKNYILMLTTLMNLLFLLVLSFFCMNIRCFLKRNPNWTTTVKGN